MWFYKNKEAMNEYDIKRLGLILALSAECAGMKAENELSKQNNVAPAYGDRQFNDIAERIRYYVYVHNEQL